VRLLVALLSAVAVVVGLASVATTAQRAGEYAYDGSAAVALAAQLADYRPEASDAPLVLPDESRIAPPFRAVATSTTSAGPAIATNTGRNAQAAANNALTAGRTRGAATELLTDEGNTFVGVSAALVKCTPRFRPNSTPYPRRSGLDGMGNAPRSAA